jgi:galactose mutarotase-like enzyme
VKLQRPPWELEVRPERGGRITSLKLRGEELLDQGIGVDNPAAEGFVEGGAWGWDEMVPNVEPTAELPDHGEAWRLGWEVPYLTRDSVLMRVSGRVVPWTLDRTIALTDHVRVSYVYRNAGNQPHLAYWCAHPLFKYEAGMEISMPALREGSSGKVFLPKGSIDRTTLRWRSGVGIEMSWDPAVTPYVGIWACNGDLGGYRQIAIEPATGGNDRPDSDQPPPLLEPGATLRWWLQIRAL